MFGCLVIEMLVLCKTRMMAKAVYHIQDVIPSIT